jgi:hypothetical protein
MANWQAIAYTAQKDTEIIDPGVIMFAGTGCKEACVKTGIF